MKKDWVVFEEYIVERLREIDPYCQRTPGSGNKGKKGDITTKTGLHLEAKQRNTKSATINSEVWKKCCEEIPLHSEKIPILALQNKDKKKWAVLELDDFLDIYIEYYKMKYGK